MYTYSVIKLYAYEAITILCFDYSFTNGMLRRVIGRREVRQIERVYTLKPVRFRAAMDKITKKALY